MRSRPDSAQLSEREDHQVLRRVVPRHRSVAVQLVAGVVLHGFYEPHAATRMGNVLRFPSVEGVSTKERADTARTVYYKVLRRGWAYEGPQMFP